MYSRKDIPPEINVFSDSSADIKAITASTQSKNEAVTLTRDILSSFKSSETQTTIAWIPSHTGIKGNEKEYKLVSTELTAQKASFKANDLVRKAVSQRALSDLGWFPAYRIPCLYALLGYGDGTLFVGFDKGILNDLVNQLASPKFQHEGLLIEIEALAWMAMWIWT
ncbi:hypothetical protein OUZ56_029637 [Daphnia magna]|uniref:RNase H type-1 domain-containing protein n=1 Tax=Daphnia magna TaxID=35525 RepID=A0ABR0B7F8_9CRUS|nr:hypothetical protein OUZ56_029637 [Daphnia magna]